MGLVSTGFIYKHFIDPMLSSIHDRSLPLIRTGSNVLDVACGTGALAFRLSTKANQVTGIDLSEKMIDTAIKTREEQKVTNVDFQIMDATDLSIFKENEFGQATISMAIHQFNPETARRVLMEVKRVSKEILIIDYACPLPKNIYKPFINIIEHFAGKEHFANFKIFQSNGGIQHYLDAHGLTTKNKIIAGNGNFIIAQCTK